MFTFILIEFGLVRRGQAAETAPLVVSGGQYETN